MPREQPGIGCSRLVRHDASQRQSALLEPIPLRNSSACSCTTEVQALDWCATTDNPSTNDQECSRASADDRGNRGTAVQRKSHVETDGAPDRQEADVTRRNLPTSNNRMITDSRDCPQCRSVRGRRRHGPVGSRPLLYHSCVDEGTPQPSLTPQRIISAACEEDLLKYGDTFRGVGYTRSESEAQQRYGLMLGVVRETTEPVSILDFGCGLAHMLDYIKGRAVHAHIQYSGLDISSK